MKFIERTSCDIASVLKTIFLPVQGKRTSPDYEHFPPLVRKYQGRDWWMLENSDSECALPYGQFETCYAIGRTYRPYLIAALGVGFGYALMSFAKGARSAGVPNATVNGYDDTGDGRLEWARQAFMTERVPYNLSHSNARQYDESGIPLRHIDLFHISNLRQKADLGKDLELVLPTLSPRGIIVVDPLTDSAMSILEVWSAANGFKLVEIHGIYILEK